MAVYNALGEALVTQDELYENADELGNLRDAVEEEAGAATVELSTGQVTSENLITSYTAATGERVPFEPVGLGKPLTVEIRHVYTGRFPETNFWGAREADMMVTSAIRSIAAFNAAPRALNFLEKGVQPNSNVRSVTATEQGTPVIYYVPALVERASVLTLEAGFNNFPEETFDMVSSAFEEAAGIPLFFSAGAYLLAAGTITKILAHLADNLIDTSPEFRATEPLSFLRPGDIPPAADFRLIVEGDVEPALLREHAVGSDGVLRDSNGEPYSGDTPYVVISLDGRKNEEYEAFAPTAASATLLDRFFGLNDGQEKPLGPLLDALKLYNDLKFRQKADELAKDLEGLDPNSERYEQKKKEYDATVANILNDLLRPK